MELDVSTAPGTPVSGDELSRTAIDCYLASMLAIAKAAGMICPQIGGHFENSVIRLRQRVAFAPTVEGLLDSLDALEADLAVFVHRTTEYYGNKAGNIAGILSAVNEAIETFETRDHLYIERLRLIVYRMEAALESPDAPAQLAVTYEQQLGHLRTFVDKLSADSKGVFEKLHQDIADIEQRLSEAEAQSGIDPLTALVNRREMERMIRDRIPSGKRFSLLLFDIRQLDAINESCGRDAGDQLLCQFGTRLAAQVRPQDLVARWGGDEFAVVFDCAATDAMARALQIAQWVSGRYPVTVEGQDWKPEIEASVAVVEYAPDEAAEHFFARADAQIPFHTPESPPEVAPANEFAADRWRTMSS